VFAASPRFTREMIQAHAPLGSAPPEEQALGSGLPGLLGWVRQTLVDRGERSRGLGDGPSTNRPPTTVMRAEGGVSPDGSGQPWWRCEHEGMVTFVSA